MQNRFDTVEQLARVHRPAMSRSVAIGWVIAWSVGLGVLGFSFGCAAMALARESALAALLGPLALAVMLLIPGVGVLRPGGARAPVILRTAMPLALMALTATVLTGAAVSEWQPAWFRGLSSDVRGLCAALFVMAVLVAPFLGVPAAYAIFVRRSRAVSSTLLVGTIVMLVLAGAFALVGGLGATSHNPYAWAWLCSAAPALVGVLFALAQSRRSPSDSEEWVSGVIEGDRLRVEDLVLHRPEGLQWVEGPVSVLRSALAPASPWRSGHPVDPRAVLACRPEQVTMLLADVRDSARSLALLCATFAALSAASFAVLRLQ